MAATCDAKTIFSVEKPVLPTDINSSSADQIPMPLHVPCVFSTHGKPHLPLVPDSLPEQALQMLGCTSSIDFLCQEHDRHNHSKLRQGSRWSLPRSGSLSGQSPPSCRKKTD